MPIGRPSKYTQELADRICNLVASHDLGLPRLCIKYPDLPEPQTINAWRREKPGFSSKYAQAKMEQAELLAESIDDIAYGINEYYYVDSETGASKIDSGLVAHARLLIDSRKWLASKLAPKIYGDKQQVTTTIKHEDTLEDLG
jgi:hypothetical protein